MAKQHDERCCMNGRWQDPHPDCPGAADVLAVKEWMWGDRYPFGAAATHPNDYGADLPPDLRRNIDLGPMDPGDVVEDSESSASRGRVP